MKNENDFLKILIFGTHGPMTIFNKCSKFKNDLINILGDKTSGPGTALIETETFQVLHKWKSFINTSYSPTSTLFAFHTNKKQYLDTLHIQKKKRNAPSDAQ